MAPSIVEGKEKRPVYLWIHDGEAENRDARHLWGKNTKESQEDIRVELGDSLIRTAQIGPGGEQLIDFASIINDLKASASRTGMGAVMGSKNLKAIAVRGRKTPNMANPAEVTSLAKWLRDSVKISGGGPPSQVGTGADLTRGRATGNLPTRNFRDGDFADAEKIGAQALKDTGLTIKMESCYACPVRCKKVVEVKGPKPYAVDPAYGGPEYETLASFGSTCGVGDAEAICKAHELCNAYSLDTISAGVTIAFAMECFENGILTREDTGGIELTFGNAEAMVKVLQLIGKREGIGMLLAEGTHKAAERLGRGAEEFAMNIKGVEIPMHDPRLKQGLGLTYSVTAHGPDHMVSIHDTSSVDEGPRLDAIKIWGFLDPLPLNDLGPRKVALCKTVHLWRHYLDSLIECMFVRFSQDQITEAVKAITGWNTSIVEELKVGERAVTLARAFNMREGLTSADDQLPRRFFQPTTVGALKETAIDPVAMDRAIHIFYRMMGWDSETGVPTAEKLEELEVEWAIEEMAKAGITAP